MKKSLKRTLAMLLSAAMLTSVGVLSGCSIDWDYCQHKLEEIPKIESTCMRFGKKTAYKCAKCGQLFAYGYLNGKDGEKGLYEIDHREVLPFTRHVIGEFYGDLKASTSSFDADSLEDFTVWSHCSEAGCGDAFEVERQNLIAFAPADNLTNAKHVSEGASTDATQFAIPAGTGEGTLFTITTSDSGMQNATHEIPFTASVDRHVVLFLHNDGETDVDVRYGIECYGERSGGAATVPANGYASMSFTINVGRTQNNSWHELYLDTAVQSSFNLTISGFYYHETKLQNIKIEDRPKIEYAIGECFDPQGLTVVADYGGGIERKLGADEYELLLNNNRPITEPLTENDDTVYVVHGNKQTKFAIRVQRFEQTVTLKGATFADGSISKIMDRNALLPENIVADSGKKIAYFIDQYGGIYEIGDGRVPAYDAILTPIYEGVTFSENYALGKSVSASSVSHGGRTGDIVDGNNSVNSTEDFRWSSASNYDTAEPSEADREWVRIDLGEVKSISQIVLYPRVHGSYFPEAYEVLVSEDGEHWITVSTVTYDALASKNSKLPRYHNFASVNAQYVKVVATKMTNDSGTYGYIFQLSEVEIYGEVTGEEVNS